MSAPANFNGQLPVIDPNDAVMLLIDHQSGLFQTVNDMPMTALRRHAGALASIATLAGIPVITTPPLPLRKSARDLEISPALWHHWVDPGDGPGDGCRHEPAFRQ